MVGRYWNQPVETAPAGAYGAVRRVSDSSADPSADPSVGSSGQPRVRRRIGGRVRDRKLRRPGRGLRRPDRGLRPVDQIGPDQSGPGPFNPSPSGPDASGPDSFPRENQYSKGYISTPDMIGMSRNASNRTWDGATGLGGQSTGTIPTDGSEQPVGISDRFQNLFGRLRRPRVGFGVERPKITLF
jgi:hypothetical protein